MRARAIEETIPDSVPLGAGALRTTIRTLAGTLGIVVLSSVVAAAGLPVSRAGRIALVVCAWTVLGALIAYLFLPGFDPLPHRVRRRLPRSLGPDAVALTFDDGPHPETTPGILSALAAEGVRATFFLVGEQVRRHPALARRIAAEGHAIGNHSQRHRLLVFRTAAQVEAEVGECQTTLEHVLGERPRLFRPPHGFKPVGLARLLRRNKLRMWAWHGAVRDTDAPGPEAIVERTLRVAGPRRVLLLHDNPSTRGQTALAIPGIVAGLRARGLRPVALPDERDTPANG